MSHELIASAQTFAGALVMCLSIVTALHVRRIANLELAHRWLGAIALMVFFLMGYIVFMAALLVHVQLPLVLISGTLFLGGACFVLLMVTLTRQTLQSLAQAAQQIHLTQERYRSLVESTTDSIFLVDEDRRFVFVNTPYLLRMGIDSPEGMIGRRYGELHTGEEARDFDDAVSRVFRTKRPVIIEHRSIATDRYYLKSLTPVFNEDETVSMVSVVAKDITEQKWAEEELRSMSFTDDMTDLNNRRGFFALFGREAAVAKRVGSKVLVLYADLDELKKINDEFGHQVGDQAIIEAARVLRETFRESDLIARIGGDEFVVAQVVASESVEAEVLTRFDAALERRRNVLPFAFSMTVGVSYYDPMNPVDLAQMIDDADQAMYRLKQQRNL